MGSQQQTRSGAGATTPALSPTKEAGRRAGSGGETAHTVILKGWDQQPCHVFKADLIGCKVDRMTDASGVRVDKVQVTLL